jgi:hypothetical protein
MITDATPAAGELFVTQFPVVSDQDRSRDFYQLAFGADVVRDRDPVNLALAGSDVRGQRACEWSSLTPWRPSRRPRACSRDAD